ncbi:MAG: transcriptional regulator, partial [Clostridiales bacterium]|nr:transcriptional regulator [Clostridiales bacterium]
IHDDTELLELQFSMEVASEAPGYAAYFLSDICFSLNGKSLGSYLSKGEFNDRAGTVNPSWWYGNLGQYGKKINISVNKKGTFIDGIQSSDVTISDLKLSPSEQIRFRIAVPENAEHRGGVTLFGKGFGDYDEGIICRYICK